MTGYFHGELAKLETNLRNEHKEDLANQIADTISRMEKAFEIERAQAKEEAEKTLENAVNALNREMNAQKEVMGAEIDRLTRKHDYLYESCTTVQVVDGELVVA